MASQDRHGGPRPKPATGPQNRRGRRDVRTDDTPRESTVDAEPQIDLEPTPVPNPPDGQDWMAQARREAEAMAWSPGGSHDDLELDLTATAALVRPYARTGGRTKPVRDLDLEALVHTTVSGKEASTGPWLTPEHTTIIEMCTGTVSVAEIAARLAVPIGVARVIIADMVDLGLVEVLRTAAAEGDERDPAFLRRVLSGLQRL